MANFRTFYVSTCKLLFILVICLICINHTNRAFYENTNTQRVFSFSVGNEMKRVSVNLVLSKNFSKINALPVAFYIQ